MTPPHAQPEQAAIALDTPIQRGAQTITDIVLRKPRSGELRGLTLTDLLQMEAGALIKLIPRISTPMLTEPDMNRLDPADLTQMGTAVAGFLLPKSAKVADSLPV
ncbi:phage tail assembly protein [Chitinimonas arctica]|uniref:Phage tail assembly protein n=2 Tax=Chitinimonas arctica TaxID=2594795 RepID=A0A516SMR6_9NEIS|nr:phage tail assembly protein [Chitinimonas arctica]